jgi:hypothetical protein
MYVQVCMYLVVCWCVWRKHNKPATRMKRRGRKSPDVRMTGW